MKITISSIKRLEARFLVENEIKSPAEDTKFFNKLIVMQNFQF